MTKKIYFIIVIAAIAAAAIVTIVILRQAKPLLSTIETDTTLKGNYAIEKNQRVVVKNNATITVKGNLTVKGVLECEGGALNLVVGGNLVVDKSLICNRKESDGLGLSLAVAGSAVFGDDSLVVSNGYVQIVDSQDKLAKTKEQLEAIYEETGLNTGTKPRIGPFIESAGGAVSSGLHLKSPIAIRKFSYKNNLEMLAPVAHAQAPAPCIDNNGNVVPNCIKISGQWILGGNKPLPPGVIVPTPPPGVNKIVLNFNFGPNKQINFQNFVLIGPNGRPGRDDKNQNCNARGKDGENAFRLRVVAHNITINNFDLWLGDGGKGGDAETIKDCDPGNATGGTGGESGNFKMEASGEFKIIGAFNIFPGRGGEGGNATAFGRDGANGCPAQKGGDATGIGGKGGKSKKDLSDFGSVTGLDNVKISPVFGGNAGNGSANPGNGGHGTGCGCKGGKGGNGTAIGGKGGDASLIALGKIGESFGGDGGNANSHGGQGGAGGMCTPEGPGGAGGNGGDASSTKGARGVAKTPGNDGTVGSEAGGNGGNGGDGCLPGAGGKGGKGKPPGKNGAPGKNLCLVKKTTTPPPTYQPAPAPNTQPPSNQAPTTQPPSNEQPIPTEMRPLELQPSPQPQYQQPTEPSRYPTY